ncbi:anti-sigma factor RsiW [Paraburkholderia bryophila]|uniref:Anti-sigma factor RsiW n=1 Tax=Paraburkholderia bryophila TaxID=420952 RepID=A0A7Y9WEQ5_9BURK|nr:anti-sigma factor RsiW [Paraburkholderia bryophila]
MNNDDHEAGLPDGLDLRALSAWVDDELPAAERAALEAKLEQHPQAAARVAAWRAQKAALQVLCGAPLRREYDERADATSEPGFIVVRRAAPWWQRVGIAACWLVAGAGIALALGPLAPRLTGGAWGGLGGQPPSFAERADVAYAVYTPERRHPVEVAASDEEHLITWLSKRLNRPLSVPSLQEYGYSLVGGRLLPGEAGAGRAVHVRERRRRAAHAVRDRHRTRRNRIPPVPRRQPAHLLLDQRRHGLRVVRTDRGGQAALHCRRCMQRARRQAGDVAVTLQPTVPAHRMLR